MTTNPAESVEIEREDVGKQAPANDFNVANLHARFRENYTKIIAAEKGEHPLTLDELAAIQRDQTAIIYELQSTTSATGPRRSQNSKPKTPRKPKGPPPEIAQVSEGDDLEDL